MNKLAKIIVGLVLLADLAFMGTIFHKRMNPIPESPIVHIDNTRQIPKSEEQLFQDEIIYPTIQIVTSSGTGTGTVIYQDDKIAYIMSAFHVTDETINQFGYFEDEKNYRYEPLKIVDKCKEFDLVMLSSKPVWLGVATFLPDWKLVHKGDQVWLHGFVGGLDHTRSLTTGLISELVNTKGLGFARTVTSSPIIFGNSGCGMFVKIEGHFYIAGVFAQVYTMKHNKTEHVICHVSFASTPKQTLDFIRCTIKSSK